MSNSQTHETDPHVLPIRNYLATWFALILLTALTFYVSYFNFGSMNIVVAIGIATLKASLVALIFMHLLYDNKFHAIILLGSILFVGVFMIFTMFDTNHRGNVDSIETQKAAKIADPFGQNAPKPDASAIK